MGYLNQICILVYFNIVIQNGGEVLSSIILPINVLSDNAPTLTLKIDSYYPILTRMMASVYPTLTFMIDFYYSTVGFLLSHPHTNDGFLLSLMNINRKMSFDEYSNETH